MTGFFYVICILSDAADEYTELVCKICFKNLHKNELFLFLEWLADCSIIRFGLVQLDRKMSENLFNFDDTFLQTNESQLFSACGY